MMRMTAMIASHIHIELFAAGAGGTVVVSGTMGSETGSTMVSGTVTSVVVCDVVVWVVVTFVGAAAAGAFASSTSTSVFDSFWGGPAVTMLAVRRSPTCRSSNRTGLPST